MPLHLRTIVAFIAAIALIAASAPDARAINIIWVSENTDNASPPSPDDVFFTDFLSGLGHTVSRQDIRNLDVNPVAMAELNAADLVIVSRDTDSGNYDDGGGAEATAWNSVTTPLILQSQFLSRNNRWLWVDNTGTPNNDDGTFQIADPTHPLFQGVALDTVGQFGAAFSNTPAIDNPVLANGQLLAINPDNADTAIGFWDAGEEFYPGAGQFAADRRLFLGVGLNADDPKGGFNLTADGQQLYINAIEFLTQGEAPASKGSVLMVGGGGNPDAGADEFMFARLAMLGYDVMYVDDNAAVTADADGKDLIVISATVNSGDAINKFKDVAVPVLNMEQAAARDDRPGEFQMATGGGTEGGQTMLTIFDPDHPLAAGLDGMVTVYDSGQTMSQLNGTLAPDAQLIAALLNGEFGIVLLEEGGLGLDGIAAPAHRVMFFLENDGMDNLTGDGLALFDAAVEFLAPTAVPEPATGLLALLGLGGLGLRRRRRAA